MPHRVANFFRNSTNSLENQVIHLKKSTIRSRTRSPNRIADSQRPSRSSERVNSTYASSIEEEMDHDHPSPAESTHGSAPHTPLVSPHLAPAVGRILDSPRLRPRLDGHEHSHDKKDKDHHHHRLSFPGLHLGLKSNKEQHVNPHAQLSWKIESPPIIFHGDAENSTGALVSGQLFLDVRDDAGYEIESFKATLQIHITQKRPYTVHCNDCTHQYTLLKEWPFLSAPGLRLAAGVHPFPFSILLDGHLPATLDSPLVNIAYEFKAEAIPAATPSSPAPAPIRLEKLFDVKRSLPPPELPHHSVRVFPPTNVKASVHYPHIIHPIGTNTLSMRLDGIAKANNQTIEYWKLKKLTWRLEETMKTLAPACDKHAPPLTPDQSGTGQQPKRATSRTETRVIGEKTLFSGWKSNYAGATDSTVELELEYALGKHARYSCDLRTRDGAAEVSHQLMLELVVSQECAPIGKPGLVTQTGVGRILRMHFSTVLTERGGIGISWDNEAPPIYQDVPPSPPAYCEDVAGGALDGLPDVMEALDAAPGPSGTGSGYASGRSSGRNSPEGHR